LVTTPPHTHRKRRVTLKKNRFKYCRLDILVMMRTAYDADRGRKQ
jgi:hypothetical protein